jgi:hypothetical protein
MPKQKDLKRLIRARMEKTGESYTAARATLLAKRARGGATVAGATIEGAMIDGATVEGTAVEGAAAPSASSAPPAAPEPPAAAEAPDYAALAGVSDETILARTGRTWKSWVDALDSAGAAALPHREIAAHVHETFDVSGWWAQSVTVGYERIKGLREIGQRRGGDFEATKSKTLRVPVERARHAFADARARARWLPGVKPTLRKTTSESALRFTWEDGTAVDVWFVAKGEAKTQVAVTHRKLASKADAEARKAFWGDRLGDLAVLLEQEETGSEGRSS